MNWIAYELAKKMPVEQRGLYNGKRIEDIANGLPDTWADCHKLDYINNCRRVIESQTNQMNLEQIEALKNYNFNLVKFYMKQNGVLN